MLIPQLDLNRQKPDRQFNRTNRTFFNYYKAKIIYELIYKHTYLASVQHLLNEGQPDGLY